MDITKRKLLAAGGLGVLVGGGTGAQGAELDPSMPGFTIKVAKRYGVWSVCVPDFEHAKNYEMMMAPTKWMSLTEWLAIMDGDVQS